MKFYQVVEDYDPATGDAFFPSMKKAVEHVKKNYDSPDRVQIVEHEIKGRLTKLNVCAALRHWPQR